MIGILLAAAVLLIAFLVLRSRFHREEARADQYFRALGFSEEEIEKRKRMTEEALKRHFPDGNRD